MVHLTVHLRAQNCRSCLHESKGKSLWHTLKADSADWGRNLLILHGNHDPPNPYRLLEYSPVFGLHLLDIRPHRITLPLSPDDYWFQYQSRHLPIL